MQVDVLYFQLVHRSCKASWPLPRLPNSFARVNDPLEENELKPVRRSAQRGQRLRDEGWTESIVRRLPLALTIRSRG